MMTLHDQPGLFDGASDAPLPRWAFQRALEETGTPVSEVTMLSFGAGQDSTYLFHRLWYDRAFREAYAPGRLLIVHADTGDEHPETYEHVERTRAIAQQRGWEFVHITADMGFHSEAWQSLDSQMARNSTIFGVGFARTCTDNLKITPIFRYLADWIARNYDMPPVRDANGKFWVAKTMKPFVERYGRVRTLLGIAAKEERRMYGRVDGYRGQVQMRQYPMVYDNIDRLDAIEAIQGWGEVVPPPSHCMRCHYQGPQQLLLLSREHPAVWDQWVGRERAKIDRCAEACATKGIANYGVFGLDLLPQVLYDAELEFGHMTTEQLREIAFTRGCSLTSY